MKLIFWIFPGIKSASIGSPSSSAVADGTSMAAPHVTGALVRYLSTQCDAPPPEMLKGWLLNTATESAITLQDIGITPNKLLYLPCFWGKCLFSFIISLQEFEQNLLMYHISRLTRNQDRFWPTKNLAITHASKAIERRNRQSRKVSQAPQHIG